MAVGHGTQSEARDRAMLAIARLESAQQRLVERPVDAGESPMDTATRVGFVIIIAACVGYAIWQL